MLVPRRVVFESRHACSVTFAVNVLLVMLIRMKWWHALPAVGLGIWMLSLGLRDLSELLSCATPIFLPLLPGQASHIAQPSTTPVQNTAVPLPATPVPLPAMLAPRMAQPADEDRKVQPVKSHPPDVAADGAKRHSRIEQRRGSTSAGEWMAFAIGAKPLSVTAPPLGTMAQVAVEAMGEAKAEKQRVADDKTDGPSDETIRRRHQRSQ